MKIRSRCTGTRDLIFARARVALLSINGPRNLLGYGSQAPTLLRLARRAFTPRPSTRIAHQTGRVVSFGLDAHDLPAFTGWCRYQVADGVSATQAGQVTMFLAAIEMNELESVRDANRPHVTRETLPE